MRALIAAVALQLSLNVAADLDAGAAAYDAGDYETAFSEFKASAEQGHAEAQYSLGVLYYGGAGVPQNYAEAANWYLKAVEQGHALALSSLGARYKQAATATP